MDFALVIKFDVRLSKYVGMEDIASENDKSST